MVELGHSDRNLCGMVDSFSPDHAHAAESDHLFR